jgi:hypothetical protein
VPAIRSHLSSGVSAAYGWPLAEHSGLDRAVSEYRLPPRSARWMPSSYAHASAALCLTASSLLKVGVDVGLAIAVGDVARVNVYPQKLQTVDRVRLPVGIDRLDDLDQLPEVS